MGGVQKDTTVVNQRTIQMLFATNTTIPLLLLVAHLAKRVMSDKATVILIMIACQVFYAEQITAYLDMGGVQKDTTAVNLRLNRMLSVTSTTHPLLLLVAH